MANKQSSKLISWLMTGPIKFALLSFVFMLLISMLYSVIFGAASQPTLFILMAISAIMGAYFMLRGITHENLDRRSFVALNNAQMLIISVAFITSTLLIVANAEQIILHLWWLESHANASFIWTMILMVLFYLYLFGLFIMNVYAKYRRARAMNISPWKIICSMPFGFSMLWIAGYVIPETKKPAKFALQIKSHWYAYITDWIMTNPINTILTLVLLIVLSGFFFGFNTILLTFALAIIFAIWVKVKTPSVFAKEIGGKYSTFAIIINIIVLVSLIGFMMFAPARDVTVNINDIATAELMEIPQQ